MLNLRNVEGVKSFSLLALSDEAFKQAKKNYEYCHCGTEHVQDEVDSGVCFSCSNTIIE